VTRATRETRTVYRIVQITTAQPNVYAIFKNDDGTLTRDLVPAWGLWDEWKVYADDWSAQPQRVGARQRESGPLILEFGALVPAERAYPEQFIGVRVGNFSEIDDRSGFDDPADGVEATTKPATGVAALHILRHGRVMCGLQGVPSAWPAGHGWVSFEDVNAATTATCTACLMAFQSSALLPNGAE
jgi:hypothetical protein